MSSILQNIQNVSDLKKLNLNELNKLSKEIRHYLIDVVSETGGHLGSNLGIVELTLALHYCFDSPNDKMVFDVGHQSYVHKIVTGRKEELKNIRQYGGISGFPKRNESEHDAFDTGHSSTSISAALGYAKKRDLLGEDFYVLSIIGDGSFTGGMAFEALNNASSLTSKFIIILNDNQMSINQNVGGMSVYLDSIRTGGFYNEVKDDVQKILKRIPRVGENVIHAMRDVKDGIKQLFIPGMFFEEMGYTYLGPIDGNNMRQVIATLNHAKKVNGPTIIHVNTEKGKGYLPAEKDASKLHSVAPFDKLTGKPKKPKKGITYSQVFGKKICELAEKDHKVVAITAAMITGTGLKTFGKKFPERLYDVGIAEQHAVTFAGGLAAAGLKPFFAVYSSFLQRGYDQLIHDICIQKLPVVFCIDRSGLVGEDGETHQGVFDTNYLNHMPNMTIMAPRDDRDLDAMLHYAYHYNDGPVSIKYPRGSVQKSKCECSKIELGCFEVVKEGENIAIIAVGSMFYNCFKVCEQLVENGYNPTLINARFLKPINFSQYDKLAEKHEKFVVVEENMLIGGYGSEIIRYMHGKKNRILTCGIDDQFITHGNKEVLLEICGLSCDKLFERIIAFIKEIIVLKWCDINSSMKSIENRSISWRIKKND